jgi:hypothetical protein
MPEGPSFDELHVAYANSVAPLKTPSGYLYKYGLVTNCFPATVSLGNVNPICDALIIQRTWNNREVCLEVMDFF